LSLEFDASSRGGADLPLEEAEANVHDVMNVFMCSGYTRDTHPYFMKASFVRPVDFIDLLVAFSACSCGDCGASHFDDTAKCHPLKIEVHRPSWPSNGSTTSPPTSSRRKRFGRPDPDRLDPVVRRGVRVNKEKFKLQHVEAALRNSGGIVTAAANYLEQGYGSCSPASVRNYIRRHPSLKKVIEETVEQNLDHAETSLIKGILSDNMTATIFYLKTKGRNRGYVERVGYVDKDGQPSDAPSVYVVVLPDKGRDAPEEGE
jgi:hypothetical protein